MANNYCDLTGVIFVNQVTPVIKALFKCYELDETTPGNGSAYIASFSEGSSTSWDSVYENLLDLIETLKLKIPEDDLETAVDILEFLTTHFKAEANEELANLLEHGDFENDADLDQLFTIARAFEDGHGMSGVKTEACWYADKKRLFEFGGTGYFTGLQFSFSYSSQQAADFGESVNKALSEDLIYDAANLLIKQMTTCLAGINDEQKRASLRSLIAAKLSESA